METMDIIPTNDCHMIDHPIPHQLQQQRLLLRPIQENHCIIKKAIILTEVTTQIIPMGDIIIIVVSNNNNNNSNNSNNNQVQIPRADVIQWVRGMDEAVIIQILIHHTIFPQAILASTHFQVPLQYTLGHLQYTQGLVQHIIQGVLQHPTIQGIMLQYHIILLQHFLRLPQYRSAVLRVRITSQGQTVRSLTIR